MSFWEKVDRSRLAMSSGLDWYMPQDACYRQDHELINHHHETLATRTD